MRSDAFGVVGRYWDSSLDPHWQKVLCPAGLFPWTFLGARSAAPWPLESISTMPATADTMPYTLATNKGGVPCSLRHVVAVLACYHSLRTAGR